MGARTQWTEALLESRLREHVDRLGRMPSSQELRAVNDNALAVQISRRGGFRQWASRLGVALKRSETRMGQRWEDHEERWFRDLGFDVERMTTKSPYDLLVGRWRVDVKAAHWTRYEAPDRTVQGFVFAGLKNGRDAQWFDLVCIADDEVAHRYVVPAAEVPQTVSITPRTLDGKGKYSKWAGALPLLHQLQGMVA